MTNNGKNLIAVAVRELDAAGIRERELSFGKHAKLRWHAPDGRPRMVTMSLSPGSHRAVYKVRADVRRLLKQDEVTLG